MVALTSNLDLSNGNCREKTITPYQEIWHLGKQKLEMEMKKWRGKFGTLVVSNTTIEPISERQPENSTWLVLSMKRLCC
jgi:hypothetical protein